MRKGTVNQGSYAGNETIVYNYLTGTMRYNNAVACGILANIEEESDFNPKVTNKSSGAYGLIQWLGGRKTNLIEHCKRLGVSHETVRGQLSFLVSKTEFNASGSGKNKEAYNKLMSLPNTKQGAYDAGYYFSKLFERPGSDTTDKRRGNSAAGKFWSVYGSKAGALNLGQQIVQVARSQIGKPRKKGGTGPDSYDMPGLVYYCYNQVGISLNNMSINALYNEFAARGHFQRISQASAGDLLFYKNTSGLYVVAIATGSGGRIYVSSASNKVVEDIAIGTPSSILRYLSDSQTSQGEIPESYVLPDSSYSDYSPDVAETEFTFVGGSAVNYVALTTSEDYSTLEKVNLNNVAAEGYDYGYLIDLTHGGSFKFYIPEFSESAGSTWSQISIIGRSVSLLSYQYTSSRKVTISLDLYAGEGLYNNRQSSDIVGKLHSDVHFVESLEYPDYSNAIARPPSKVHLILGSAVSMTGVVSDVSVEHLKPFDTQNRAMYIKLSFTVTQVESNPPDYKDIRNGQYSIISSKNNTLASSGSTVESTNNPSNSSPTSTNNTNAPKYN